MGDHHVSQVATTRTMDGGERLYVSDSGWCRQRVPRKGRRHLTIGDDDQAPSTVVSPEFKAQIVALGRRLNTVGSVCRDYELAETAACRWVREAEVDDGLKPSHPFLTDA